jgi:hypothetical protein
MAEATATPPAQHTRLVIAIEASAVATEFHPVFRQLVYERLLGLLQDASFEVRDTEAPSSCCAQTCLRL